MAPVRAAGSARRGKLIEFYRAFVADPDDPTGQKALETVLGEPLDRFEPRWPQVGARACGQR